MERKTTVIAQADVERQLDFCEKVALQPDKTRLEFGILCDTDGGPVDIKEMKGINILEIDDTCKVSEAELSTYAEPEGVPRVDFSMDDEIGFGASSDIPNLAEELSKWTSDAEEIEDIVEVIPEK